MKAYKPILTLFVLIPFFFAYLVQCGPAANDSAGNSAQDEEITDPELTEIWDPQPPVVSPVPVSGEPPEDAIILFDGTSLDAWESVDGSAPEWTLENGYMTVQPGTGDIKTRQNFSDVQLHIEWRAPEVIVGEGQGRGNSGVFLQERYEVQVLDNWENPTYSNGMAGSIYKQHIPLANPAKRPGEWQTYQIFFKSPVFDNEGNIETPARFTVLLNGVLIQNNVEVFGNTRYIGAPSYEVHGPAGIRLQDHGDYVSFRNIWIRELDEEIRFKDGIWR
ncbi:DUF1080 domain-containing protein [Balneolaceae bacterium ANBcel3]|nr:DUF1080 domain-containing protein [Balneolaceae bacterium ANBcel3]